MLMLLVISFAQLKSSLRLKILYKLHVITLFLADKCHITGSLHKLIVKPLLSHSGCQSSYILPSELHASCQLLCRRSLVHSSLPLLSIGKCRRSCPQERETAVPLTSKLSQSCLKIVPELGQNCPKVGSKLSQNCPKEPQVVSAHKRETAASPTLLPVQLPVSATGARVLQQLLTQCYRCQMLQQSANTVLLCYSVVLPPAACHHLHCQAHLAEMQICRAVHNPTHFTPISEME